MPVRGIFERCSESVQPAVDNVWGSESCEGATTPGSRLPSPDDGAQEGLANLVGGSGVKVSLYMEQPPTAGANLADLALVRALIRKGDLYVEVGGAWVAPEAELHAGRILLNAYSPYAVEESE